LALSFCLSGSSEKVESTGASSPICLALGAASLRSSIFLPASVPPGEDIPRRRLIALAEGQIARLEGGLRPKRDYFRWPTVP